MRNIHLVYTTVLIIAALQLEAAQLFVSPGGTENGAGTVTDPTTLGAAVLKVAAGDTIFMRGGTYTYNSRILIERDNCGSEGKLKHIFAYNNEKPMLDFSDQPYTSSTSTNERGIQLNAHYWHLRGLEVKGAADNGIFVGGNYNIVEYCIMQKNRDSGLQISRYKSDITSSEWPSYNLVLNCESYDNWDKPPCSGENADGFACKLTSGPGNEFRGCYSHNNIDDGWDMYTKDETGPIGTVVIDRCIASHNGTLSDGTTNENGDRNGFKLGGAKIAVVHIVTRSVAFGNGKNGFTWNSNPGAIILANCLAFDNEEGNYKFGDNSTPTEAVFTNNLSFWNSTSNHQSDKRHGEDIQNTNCWWDKSKDPPSINGKGLLVTAADFAAPLTNPTIKRLADGSLDFSVFKLATGSDLTDAGVVPAGNLPFNASNYYSGKPDLGAYEEGSTPVKQGQKNNDEKSSMTGFSLVSFNATTLILSAPLDKSCEVAIFSVNGKKVTDIPLIHVIKGNNVIQWNGYSVSGGTYLIRTTSNTGHYAMKGVLIK